MIEDEWTWPLGLGVSGGHFNYVPKLREQSQARSEKEELELPSAKRLDKDLGPWQPIREVPMYLEQRYIGTDDLNVFCFLYIFGFHLKFTS